MFSYILVIAFADNFISFGLFTKHSFFSILNKIFILSKLVGFLLLFVKLAKIIFLAFSNSLTCLIVLSFDGIFNISFNSFLSKRDIKTFFLVDKLIIFLYSSYDKPNSSALLM